MAAKDEVVPAAGAPRRRDVERNRAALLAAAHDLFATRVDAPLHEVALRAGVGQATLYRHFPDRGALLAALAREALDRLVSGVELADPAATPSGRLRALARALAMSPPLLAQLREALSVATRRPDPSDLLERVVTFLDTPSAGDGSLATRGSGDLDEIRTRIAMVCGAIDAAGADPEHRLRLGAHAARILAPGREDGPSPHL